MGSFSSFIAESGLIDLPLSRGKFTWSSNKETPTYCRLDRFLIGASFIMQFPNLVQKLWPKSLSDHNPVTLESLKSNWGPIPFRFYNHWMDLDGFRELVKSQWERLSSNNTNPLTLWSKFRDLK
ncbi:hypothetical protein PTKIN_Ptkin14bG0027900 [Pterospermum kingtungense]